MYVKWFLFNATFNTYSITTRRGFHWCKLDIFLLWRILRLLFQTRWSSCLQWWFFLSFPRETRLPPLRWEVSASFKLVWLSMCTFIWLIECCLNNAVSSNKAISQMLIQKQLFLGTQIPVYYPNLPTVLLHMYVYMKRIGLCQLL